MEIEMTLTVPTSWDDVTLGQFQELAALDKGLDDLDRLVEVCAILTDQDPATICGLPLDVLHTLSEKLAWTGDLPTADFERAITLGDDVFAIVPDLNGLTVGEWVDMENYAADLMGNLHLFLAILYRPVTQQTVSTYAVEPYDSVSMLERAELFRREMRVGTVYGASLFFSLIGLELLPISAASSA